MKMPSDLEVLQVCADTYRDDAQWDASWSTNDIQVRARAVGDFDVIAFRGSKSVLDWVRDFQVIPVYHPRLGMVHEGFVQGIEPVVVPRLLKFIQDRNRPYILTGHSLGAARACVVAGLMSITPLFNGSTVPPAAVVLAGCPRPGFKTLSEVINSGGGKVRIYKNRRDPVADVPSLLPFWVKPSADILVDAGDSGEHSLFADHHMPLYLKGVEELLKGQ